jgi:hypothetical protein
VLKEGPMPASIQAICRVLMGWTVPSPNRLRIGQNGSILREVRRRVYHERHDTGD